MGSTQVLYHKRKAAGVCVECAIPVNNKSRCVACMNKRTVYRKKCKEAGLCWDCKAVRERVEITLCNKCSNRNINKCALSRQQIRIEAFTKYGGYRCNCCGETNEHFLQLDHINNDGAEHRKTVGGGGCSLYFWLKRNNWPEGYQVLCANCNWGKRLTGVCPHKHVNNVDTQGDPHVLSY